MSTPYGVTIAPNVLAALNAETIHPTPADAGGYRGARFVAHTRQFPTVDVSITPTPDGTLTVTTCAARGAHRQRMRVPAHKLTPTLLALT